MSTLASLKRQAERNPDFAWNTAPVVSVDDFDPEFFLRWAGSIGHGFYPWGTGIGQSLPDHAVHRYTKRQARCEIAVSAAINCGDSTAKMKKLRAYFDERVPESAQAFEKQQRARRLIAEHAEYLPVVHYGNFLFDRESLDNPKKGIPVFYSRSTQIHADTRDEEWKQAKLAELQKKLEWFYDAKANGSVELKRRIQQAESALAESNELWDASISLEKSAQRKVSALLARLQHPKPRPTSRHLPKAA